MNMENSFAARAPFACSCGILRRADKRERIRQLNDAAIPAQGSMQ